MIDPLTIRAYLETEYRVFDNPAFTLLLGEFSPGLLDLHHRHRVDCSAFITACNPHSRLIDAPANQARQRALRQELQSRQFSCIDGIGQHPANQWPGEESFLVPGLALDAARHLGITLEQNAIVWSSADAVPRLILLR